MAQKDRGLRRCLCIEVTEALSASTAAQAPVEEKKEEKKETKALVNSGTTVIAPKTQVTVETPKHRYDTGYGYGYGCCRTANQCTGCTERL